jgi:hypothetical protein
MNYGICDQAVVPVRQQPGERYEMVNQMLFGDLVVIKGTVKDWLLVETFDDQYEGWVDRKQLSVLSNEEFNELIIEDRVYAMDAAMEVYGKQSGKKLILTRGALLTAYNNGSFIYRNDRFGYPGNTYKPGQQPVPDDIERLARAFQGSPYLWGGRSPFGIDCSGLVQVVFKMNGIFLPRDSSQQVTKGDSISFVHEAQPGDLAFFGNEEGDIIHVGIIISDQHIIHASGHVRIDKIDHQGIFNVDTSQYSHNLRIIKRVF